MELAAEGKRNAESVEAVPSDLCVFGMLRG